MHIIVHYKKSSSNARSSNFLGDLYFVVRSSYLKSIFYKSNLENPSAFKISSIFAHWMHGNMRAIWGNFEGRWIFQVGNSYKKWTLENGYFM